MVGRRESEEREKGRRETFRSVDLMNLKLRRRLFVGLLFYAACTQGHQTQRNKIPRYVCAAYSRRTYGYEFNVYSPSRACVWHHIKALLSFFFISLPHLLSPQTTTGIVVSATLRKKYCVIFIIFRSPFPTVRVCECKIHFDRAILICI